jgi:murein DD-endopeptidase MepM/ murein hydrolase activator NlpD
LKRFIQLSLEQREEKVKFGAPDMDTRAFRSYLENMTKFFARITVLLLPALILIAGCAREEVEEPFTPSSSHSAYVEGLEKMGLAESTMGSRWIEAARSALEEPLAVELPFREEGFFDPARPEAWGYRFSVPAGREVVVELELPSQEELKVFADIFRLEDDGGDEEQGRREVHHVASYSRQRNEIRFEVLKEGSYLLRLQPELLVGGRFTVAIRHTPLLSFPVEGARMADIQSFYGDSRDAGARRHEGVDIFAPRGTPVLAVTESTVRRVGTRDLGGKVVLLWDEERQFHYYYAHLDSQLTSAGTRVQPGDVVGTVGNTGNARTTPPHLHFGIYQRWWDALNPWSFLEPASGEAPPPRFDPSRLDRWMVVERRIPAEQATGRTSGGAEPPELPAGTPVRVVGAAGERVRVLSPDGTAFIHLPADALGAPPASGEPALGGELPEPPYLYDEPRPEAQLVGRLESRQGAQVLGSWNGFRLLRLGNGRTGWLPSS